MEKGFSNVIQDRFVLLFLAFLCAVFLSSLFAFDYIRIALFIFLVSILLVFYGFRVVTEFEFRKRIFLIAMIIGVFGFGVFRYGIKDFHILDEQLISQIGSEVSLEMKIVEEPIMKGSYREYIGESVNYGKEKVLIRADPYPEFMYGDMVLFRGTLQKPEKFETETGRSFDYPKYLSREDIFLTLSFAKGEIVSRRNGNFFKATLLSFKREFILNFENTISEPESSLLSGILLGQEDSLGREWEDKFRKTGISHIVVLSGYNITLVAESILKVFSFLPLRTALLGSSLGIVLFTIAVGGGASVIRASTMALFVLLARATGRTYGIARGLLLAGFLMVIVNPKILVFDFGFQLSFLATAALIWIAPLIEPYLTWCPEKWKIREILSATLATQIAVLPLLLYTTGLFSLLSIPVNLLILPVVPITMFLGFITGAVGFLGSWASFTFGAISQFFLMYIFKIVEVFSQVNFLTFSLKSFSWVFLVLGYVVLGCVFLKLKVKQEEFEIKKNTS